MLYTDSNPWLLLFIVKDENIHNKIDLTLLKRFRMWNCFTAVGNLTLKTVTADKFSLSSGFYSQEADGDEWQ